MNRFLKLSFYWICISCCFSCNDALFNEGKITSKTIIFPNDIDVLEIESIFDITLKTDTVNKAIITCGENLIEKVNAVYNHRQLSLNHSISANWSRNYNKVKIELHFKYLPRINIRQPANIIATDTLKTDLFVAVIWSKLAEIDACIDTRQCILNTSFDDFGIYRLRGKSCKSTFFIGGSGWLQANSLLSDTCIIIQQSISDASVYAKKYLDISFNSTGAVIFTGNPDSIRISGNYKNSQLVRN